MPIGEVDALGIFCDDDIINFVGWQKDGKVPNGPLQHTAIFYDQWWSDFIETGGANPLQKGDSLGRKNNDDRYGRLWTYPGGVGARSASPSFRNLDRCGQQHWKVDFRL